MRCFDTDIEYSIPSLPKSDRKISNTYDSGAMTSEERISKNAKAAKTITIVKSTILFFWMPLILLSWTSMIGLRQKVFGGFGGCLVLPSTNSAMNPTLFLFFNKEFRESFIKLLFFQLGMSSFQWIWCAPNYLHPGAYKTLKRAAIAVNKGKHHSLSKIANFPSSPLSKHLSKVIERSLKFLINHDANTELFTFQCVIRLMIHVFQCLVWVKIFFSFWFINSSDQTNLLQPLVIG